MQFYFQDVNVDHPDKKSVMMYVMCFFQVLPHDNITLEDATDAPDIVRQTKPSEVSRGRNIDHNGLILLNAQQ